MPRSLVRFVVVCLAVAVCATTALVFAQTKGKRPVRRAEPPQIEPRPELFFPDAFAEALSGSRPANLSQPAAVAANGSSTSPAPAVGAPAASDASPSGSDWSAIISGATIEDAIKAFKLQVDADVTTPSHYAGKGFKAARRDFSMLAMLFAIAGEYDGEVRWKKDAPAARDVLARTAANSKVGSQQVFNEAKLRKQELQDLVGGQSPFGGKEAEVKANWANVCDRPPLMQHLELIFEPRVKAAVASESAFKSELDKLAHDAEIIAAIGAVLAKEGMMDADSDEYKAFCEVLKTSGREIVEACKNKNYEAAGAAVSAIGKSCNDCHESYRSN